MLLLKFSKYWGTFRAFFLNATIPSGLRPLPRQDRAQLRTQRNLFKIPCAPKIPTEFFSESEDFLLLPTEGSATRKIYDFPLVVGVSTPIQNGCMRQEQPSLIKIVIVLERAQNFPQFKISKWEIPTLKNPTRATEGIIQRSGLRTEGEQSPHL